MSLLLDTAKWLGAYGLGALVTVLIVDHAEWWMYAALTAVCLITAVTRNVLLYVITKQVQGRLVRIESMMTEELAIRRARTLLRRRGH